MPLITLGYLTILLDVYVVHLGQRILILVEYLGMGIDVHVHLARVKFQWVALLSTLLDISAPNIVHLRQCILTLVKVLGTNTMLILHE